MNRVDVIGDEEKWLAVVNCAKGYDELFLYGVKTTGIFCRPSCKAKAPVRENVVYFNSADQAISLGFRPCKRCRPDKAIFQPDVEMVQKAKALLDQDISADIHKIAHQLGVSQSHLARLFKERTTLPMAKHITKLRLERAIELLV